MRGEQMKNNGIVKIGLLILILVFAIGLSLWIGIDFAIRTLILVMCVDYVLGLSLAISDKSKHGDGGLSSHIGYKGLVKKINMLLLVGVAVIVENFLIGMGLRVKYIKDIIVIAFVLNEIISILENSKLMGLDITHMVSQALKIFKNKK
ncbi:toxin secretion/phage lysis holin [Candidatus Arthromitus sp. SFB-mouse-NYU]|nr:toxin secretion/phage lysis holin [Candidatus Arthromitus sp. SFB-mouse-NYU]